VVQWSSGEGERGNGQVESDSSEFRNQKPECRITVGRTLANLALLAVFTSASSVVRPLRFRPLPFPLSPFPFASWRSWRPWRFSPRTGDWRGVEGRGFEGSLILGRNRQLPTPRRCRTWRACVHRCPPTSSPGGTGHGPHSALARAGQTAGLASRTTAGKATAPAAVQAAAPATSTTTAQTTSAAPDIAAVATAVTAAGLATSQTTAAATVETEAKAAMLATAQTALPASSPASGTTTA
jgi:hypothetical protein